MSSIFDYLNFYLKLLTNIKKILKNVLKVKKLMKIRLIRFKFVEILSFLATKLRY